MASATSLRPPRWLLILSVSMALLGMGLWVTHLPGAQPMGLP